MQQQVLVMEDENGARSVRDGPLYKAAAATTRTKEGEVARHHRSSERGAGG